MPLTRSPLIARASRSSCSPSNACVASARNSFPGALERARASQRPLKSAGARGSQPSSDRNAHSGSGELALKYDGVVLEDPARDFRQALDNGIGTHGLITLQ